METKKTMNAKVLTICMLLAVVLSVTPTLALAGVYTNTTSASSVTLQPNTASHVQSNNLFGVAANAFFHVRIPILGAIGGDTPTLRLER